MPLDHLVGLLQSVDAVGFFCEQLNGILSVQEAQELFCQFGVLGVSRNLKLLNGAHNIAGLAVIQNGCAGQTKLKAVARGASAISPSIQLPLGMNRALFIIMSVWLWVWFRATVPSIR